MARIRPRHLAVLIVVGLTSAMLPSVPNAATATTAGGPGQGAPAAAALTADCPGFSDAAIAGLPPEYRSDVTIGAFENKAAIYAARWAPGIDQGFVPQGVAPLADGTVLVSGYYAFSGTTELDEKDQFCGIYKVRLDDPTNNTGIHLASFPPAVCGHGGGIAVVGSPAKVIISDSTTLIIADYEKLISRTLAIPDNLTAHSPDIHFIPLAPKKKNPSDVAGSFLTVDPDDAYIWIGTWWEGGSESPSIARKYLVDDLVNGSSLPGSAVDSRPLPQSAQGAVTFETDSGTEWWASRSNTTCGQMTRSDGTHWTFMPGSEEIDLAPDQHRMITISESGTRKWPNGPFTPLLVEFDRDLLENGGEPACPPNNKGEPQDLGSTWSTSGVGTVAFSCDGDICITDLKSGDPINVTNTPGWIESDPTWTPDGLTIVAVQAPKGSRLFRPQSSVLVSIDVTDPLEPGQINPTGLAGFAPSISPAGKLAFSRFVSATATWNRAPIEVVVAEYNEVREHWVQRGVVSLGGNEWTDPSWNPNGTDIIATLRKGQPFEISAPPIGEMYRLPPFGPPAGGSLNLVVGGLEAGEIRTTREGRNGLVEGSYSPDGNQIVVVGCSLLDLTADCTPASRRLVVMSRDGSRAPGFADLTDIGEMPRNPSWSPDGSTVAYSSQAGIGLIDVTTGTATAMSLSALGDVQPAWRPEVGRGAVETVDDTGNSLRAFREGQPVNVRVPFVPETGSPASVCVFDASMVTLIGGLVPCVAGAKPGPVRSAAVANAEDGMIVGFDESSPLGPGRYAATVRFADGTELVSSPFAVTCFGGSCDVFPNRALADSLRRFADAHRKMSLVIEASCLWYEYTSKVLEASRMVASGPLGALGFIGMQGGEFLASYLVQGEFNKQIVNSGREAIQQVISTRLLQEIAKDQLYGAQQSSSPAAAAARTFLEGEINNLDTELKANLAKNVVKSVGVISVCVLIKGLFESVADTAEQVADRLDGFQPPAGIARPSALRSAGNDAAPQALRASLAPGQAGTAPLTLTPSEPLVGDDPSIDSVAAILGAAGNGEELVDVLGAALSAPSDELDARFGALADASSSIGSWAALARTMGDAGLQYMADAGLDPSGPAADPAVLDAVVAFRDRITTDGFADFELAGFQAAGATPADIDAALAAISGFDPTPLRGLTGEDLVAQLDDAVAELDSASRAVADQSRVMRAALSNAPWADPTSAVTELDQAIGVDLPIFDPQGNDLSVEVVDQPSHGTVTMFGSSVLYQPAPGFLGIDTLSYTASNGAATSAPATVTIEVKLPAPDPQPDDYGTRQDVALVVPNPGVLTNDVSPRIPLAVELVTSSSGGSVQLSAGGGFTFTPTSGFVGTTTFTYRASYPGSAWSDPVTATVTIVDAADPPAANPDSVTTLEDTAVTINPIANDVDPDGDPITLLGTTAPSSGRVTCSAATCSYQPARDFNGSDSFRYTIGDGTARHGIGIVTITVVGAPDAPTAAPDTLSFDKGFPATIDLLANDSHPDGRPFTFNSASGTTNGTLDCDPAGVCTYTPNDVGIVGDQATYSVVDDVGKTATGSVTIRAFRSFEEIVSDGPLLYVDVGSTLSCATEYIGDDLGAFFADFGCGTFVAVNDTLYGPERISGSGNPPQPRTTFTRIAQTAPFGAGTLADPAAIETTVGVGSTGIVLHQLDSYVTGEESYRTDLTATNTGTEPVSLTMYRAGDCQLADFDTGFGRVDASSGAAACVAADGRIIEWLPLSSGATGVEGLADDVWAAVASRQPFDGTCQCADDIDNGAGISWSLTLAPGESSTRSHLSVFSPFGYSPLQLDVVADNALDSVGGSNGYTITVTNPVTTTPVIASSITLELPHDFAYLPGSTTGDVAEDPSDNGGRLTWDDVEIPANGSMAWHVGVDLPNSVGTYDASAYGASPTGVLTFGPGAPITLTDNVAPFADIETSGGGSARAFDGSGSFDPDGTLVELAWAFGDGSTATGTAVDHSYATPGTYAVELTVTDDDGATDRTSVQVTVDPPNLAPTAVATSSRGAASSELAIATSTPDLSDPLTMALDASGSSDPDGALVELRWDFGDGTEGVGGTLDHRYPAPGTYRVTLTVTDDAGASDATTIDVVVAASTNLAPVAAFVGSASGLRATLDGTASSDPDGPSGQPIRWVWELEGTTIGSGATVDHVFPADGIYDVTLTVFDRFGASDTTTRSIGVGTESNLRPIADFTTESNDLTVDFDASLSTDPDGTIAALEWDFGDGDVGAGPATHTFRAPGTYSVELLVIDDDGAVGTRSMEVTVPSAVGLLPPVARFTSNATGLLVDFDASSSSATDGSLVSYDWDFGDGTTGSGVAATHTYSAGGTYLVRLTVTDDADSTASVTVSVAVVTPNRPPIAAFTHDSTGLQVDFDASTSRDPDGTIVSFEWDFGDSLQSTSPSDSALVVADLSSGPTISHTYPATGTYLVTLTVTDDAGAVGATSTSIDVRALESTTTTSSSTSTTSTTSTTTTTTSTTVPGSTSVPMPEPTSASSTTPESTTPTSTSNTTIANRLPILTATPPQVSPGQRIALTAEGFAAGILVTFVAEGSLIGSITTDSAGRAVLITFAMPRPGTFTVLASSIDGRRSSAVVEVLAGEPASQVPITDELPATGSDSFAWLRTSLALLLAGAFLVAVARRRRGDANS